MLRARRQASDRRGRGQREKEGERGRKREKEGEGEGEMARTDESVEKLSSKLLQGWTMLSETCPQPNCSVPLMRSRDSAEVG